MKFTYDPFILRKLADNRIFFINCKMPFDCFVDCFHNEQPFFLVAQLEDGRIAALPNPTVMPLQLFATGFWPRDLFPQNWEYVTLKNGIFPVIMTAHPVAKIDEFLKKFEKLVLTFGRSTLAEYVTTTGEFLPLEVEKFHKFEKTGMPIPMST